MRGKRNREYALKGLILNDHDYSRDIGLFFKPRLTLSDFNEKHTAG